MTIQPRRSALNVSSLLRSFGVHLVLAAIMTLAMVAATRAQTPPTQPSVLFGGQEIGEITVADGHVYFTTTALTGSFGNQYYNWTLYRVSVNGGAAQFLASGVTSHRIGRIAVTPSRVAFIAHPNGVPTFYSLDKTKTPPWPLQTVPVGFQLPDGLALSEGENVYLNGWQPTAVAPLIRINLLNPADTELLGPLNRALDGNDAIFHPPYIYYAALLQTCPSCKEIRRVHLVTRFDELVVAVPSHGLPTFALDDNYLYFGFFWTFGCRVDSPPGLTRVSKSDFVNTARGDFSNTTNLFPERSAWVRAAAGGKVYFYEGGCAGNLRSAPPVSDPLYTTQSTWPHFLVTDGSALYWVDLDLGPNNYRLLKLPLGSLSFSPTQLVFPHKTVHTTSAPKSIRVHNSASSPLQISVVSLSGSSRSQFAISSDGCTGATLWPAASCDVSLTFVPTVSGIQTATLSVVTSMPVGASSLTVQGTGVLEGAFPLLPVPSPGPTDLRHLCPELAPSHPSDGASIVLTHGWQGGSYPRDVTKLWTASTLPRQAGSLICEQLRAAGKRANVFQFSWMEAFQGSSPTADNYIAARQGVYAAGESLYLALQTKLGALYSRPIHFIGHSLGSAVNAYAAQRFLAQRGSAEAPQEVQFTILDYPRFITKLIGLPLPGARGITSEEQAQFGFDENFFASVLPAERPGLSLRIDNFYGDSTTNVSFAAVGSAINGTRIYNHPPLIEPHKVGDRYLSDEGIENDHSGVHQWYRWTFDPNGWDTTFRICSTETGELLNMPLFFHSALNPCKKGWHWSLLGPIPGDFPSALTNRPIRTLTNALNVERYISYGCTIRVGQTKTTISCPEASSPFAVAEVQVPNDADFLTFDFTFANTGDGDYVALLVDDIPVWKTSGLNASPGQMVTSGPIPVRGFRGRRTLVVALYGVGEKNAGFSLENLRTSKVVLLGDVDMDGDVDSDDLARINAALNTAASGPNDPRDLDGDGRITGLDARKLVTLCTRPRCATR
ncbi:MAG: hypothetical protein AMXMBFR59_42170 [Rhodanobacteraceae bacterium]